MAEEQEDRQLIDTLRPSAEFGMVVKEDPRARERVNIGYLMADMLKEEGVEYVFYLTGGGTATFIRPLQINKIKAVHVRSEQAAGFAMDAWGRMTRRPGFALPGSGTGLTAFSTGLCQAYSAGSPGVVVQMESGPFDDGRYGGQGVARSENQFKGMTKWVRRVTTPNTLLWNLKEAFRSAVTPPYGPVAIGCPNAAISAESIQVERRVALQAIKEGVWKPEKVWADNKPDPAHIEAVVKWLLEAEKPVIIAGHCAHQDDAQEEYREFAHLLGVPSSARRIARGMISELDPLNYGRRARGPVFNTADRCIVLGLRIGSLEGFGNAPFFPHHIRYVQLQSHTDYTELNLPTDIEVIGNLKQVMKMMVECAKDMGIKGPLEKWAKWRQFVRETDESYKSRVLARTDKLAHRMPLHPDMIGRYVSEVGSEDYNNEYVSIIDALVGSAYFTAWNICTHTASTLDATETIGFGHAPGMALAGALATNRKVPFFAVMGDGAVGFGGMDIESCARWDIPCVFLHENNNALITGAWQNWNSKVCAVEGNPLHDSTMTMPDIHYEKMFAEMGAYPEFVDRPENLKAAIKRAFAVSMREKRPSFVETFVDADVVMSTGAGPQRVLAQAAANRWDDIPDQGHRFIAFSLVSPALLPRLPKDWQDGIAALQAQKK